MIKGRFTTIAFLLLTCAIALTACSSTNALAVAQEWVAENEAAVGASIAGVVRTQAVNNGVPSLVADKFSDELVTEQIQDNIDWTFSEPREDRNTGNAVVTARGSTELEAFGLSASASFPIDIFVDMGEGVVADHKFRIQEATVSAEYGGQSIEIDREAVEESAGEAIKDLLGK